MVYDSNGNKDMDLAWRFIAETGTSLFLTGKAGTGKTTFLRRLKHAQPKRMVVLAPTGVAALNAEGQTIHSFFQLPLSPFVPGFQHQEQRNFYRMGKEKKKLIRSLDLLVIDEISMVRCDLLDAVDDVLRKYKDAKKPFGGVQLLMIGDLQQLAPVAKDDEWALLSKYYQTPYFFSSKALQQMEYATIELQTVYRQQDDEFVSLLGRIRENRIDEEVLKSLNGRYIPGFVAPEGQQWIKLTTHNYMAQQHNQISLERLATEPHTFTATIKGNFPEYSFPTDVELTLKVGAQVMFVKNDPSTQHLFYNGKIGIVKAIDDNKVIVYTPGDKNPVEVVPMEWENMKYSIDEHTKEISESVDGVFSQLPLRLAWAITVHKSQGLTFDHAVIEVDRSFAHGQVYVALSRCRTLEGMVLSQPLNASSVINDQQVSGYVNEQSAKAQENNALLSQQRFTYYSQLMDDLFSFQHLINDFDYYVRVVDNHLGNQYTDYLRQLFELRNRLNDEVGKVAFSFQHQYHAILQPLATVDFENNALLKQRVLKASIYFAEKLHDILDDVKETILNIENKAVKKQYDNAFTTFLESYGMKLTALEYAILNGFSVSTYLKTKALGLLKAELPKVQKPRQRRSRTNVMPKAAEQKTKTDTKRESLRMFEEGKGIEAIAAERGLKAMTIEGHLAHFVGTGELDIRKVVSSKHEQMIRTIISRMTGSYTLSDVKADLPGFITYMEIKAVQEKMKGEEV